MQHYLCLSGGKNNHGKDELNTLRTLPLEEVFSSDGKTVLCMMMQFNTVINANPTQGKCACYNQAPKGMLQCNDMKTKFISSEIKFTIIWLLPVGNCKICMC